MEGAQFIPKEINDLFHMLRIVCALKARARGCLIRNGFCYFDWREKRSIDLVRLFNARDASWDIVDNRKGRGWIMERRTSIAAINVRIKSLLSLAYYTIKRD